MSSLPFCSERNQSLWEKACVVHEGQRYGSEAKGPSYTYDYHLNGVREVLHRFGLANETREQGVIFHDALEDQGKRVNESLLYSWGVNAQAIDIVQRVTDSPGATRKERKLRTYPRTAASEDAVIVKLCDRIANVEEGLKEKHPTLKTYVKEHVAFKEALQRISYASTQPLWAHLDKLIARSIAHTKEEISR